MKSKSDTQNKLIKAVAQVLADQGFNKIGVNAVAREAGVDKVLIYRYFDGLEGLMEAYAKSTDFWPSFDELIGDANQQEALKSKLFGDAIGDVFERYALAIRSRPLTMEILAWETIERNALTIALEEVRESSGLELLNFLADSAPPEADWQAITTIFSASINYLAVRSRGINNFAGINLKSDEEWQRLIAAMRFLANNISV